MTSEDIKQAKWLDLWQIIVAGTGDSSLRWSIFWMEVYDRALLTIGDVNEIEGIVPVMQEKCPGAFLWHFCVHCDFVRIISSYQKISIYV